MYGSAAMMPTSHPHAPDSSVPVEVGTCPYCGYPSIGSGMCAFCRPQLVR